MSADFMVKAKKGYGKSFKIFEGSSLLWQYGKSLPLKPDVLPDNTISSLFTIVCTNSKTAQWNTMKKKCRARSVPI